MKQLRLLVRADDAGLNRTTNRAIRAAVKQGIVKNVSLIATGPQIEDAVDVLSDLAETVDLGVHVCLTSEWRKPRYRPLIEGRDGLAGPDGVFPADSDALAELKPEVDVVRQEVRAQLERLRSLGIEPTYVDEHMLVGEIPAVAEAIAGVAEEAGLIYDRKLRKSGAISEIPGWNGPGPHPGTEFADHLSGTAPGTYLIVGHPGFKADEMRQLAPVSGPPRDVLQERNRERRMFADIEIVDYCENAGVTLLRYRDLSSG